jgi:hypothetical protein
MSRTRLGILDYEDRQQAAGSRPPLAFLARRSAAGPSLPSRRRTPPIHGAPSSGRRDRFLPPPMTTDADALAIAALRLRAWAIRALASTPAAPPLEPLEAWRLFLQAERCALPLQNRLEAVGVRPDAGAAALLRERSTVELQRILSARAEMRRVGAALRERGWPGVALKGAACALLGEPVDMSDADVLVRTEHAEALAEVLGEAVEHRRVGSPVEAGRKGVWHLAALVTPSAVPIEIHYDLPLLGEIDPWAGTTETPEAGLRALSPPLHLWHVLVHGAFHHPERCGSLRELLVLRAAARRCSPEEMREVEARVDASAARELLRRVMAWVAMPGEEAARDDPFRAAAALRYSLWQRPRPSEGAGRWERTVMTAAFTQALGHGQPRLLWGRHHMVGVFTPWDSALAPLKRNLRSGGRAAHLALATLRARPLALHARRIARAAFPA